MGTDDVTSTIKTYLLFNAFFGVTSAQSGLANSVTLLQATVLQGGGLTALDRHAAAALPSADSGISYPYTVAGVRALYRDAVGADPGPETVDSALALLSAANNLKCPFDSSGATTALVVASLPLAAVVLNPEVVMAANVIALVVILAWVGLRGRGKREP